MATMSRNYNQSYNDLYDAVIKTIEILNFNLKSEDKKSGILQAKVSSSLWSWGEIINIKITNVEDKCKVEIESDASNQIIDWGKAEKNIIRFFEALESYL